MECYLYCPIDTYENGNICSDVIDIKPHLLVLDNPYEYKLYFDSNNWTSFNN